MSLAPDRLIPLGALLALTLAACDRPAASVSANDSALAPPPPPALVAAATTAERAALDALPKGEGHDLVVGSCLACHGVTMIAQQHKDTTGWNKTVTQMVGWGAPLSKENQPALVRYLATNYPARAAKSP